MNLIDGSLIYEKLSVSEFISESSTWPTGLCGVICDNASLADSNLALQITEYNALLSRSMSVYNYDSDTINYYRIDPERFPFNFDRIHREQWRRRAIMLGKSPSPETNSDGTINISYLQSKHIADSSYAVGFLTIPSDISGIDYMASQIAYDYTYASYYPTDRSYKNKEMKRTSNIYYVYDQVENFFYKFL